MSKETEPINLWTMVAEGNPSNRKARVTGIYKTKKLYAIAATVGLAVTVGLCVVVIVLTKGKLY